VFGVGIIQIFVFLRVWDRLCGGLILGFLGFSGVLWYLVFGYFDGILRYFRFFWELRDVWVGIIRVLSGFGFDSGL